MKTLVLARGGKAMAVVTSYGPGGEVVLNFDRNALDLADNVTAVDVESGRRLERLSSGQFKLKFLDTISALCGSNRRPSRCPTYRTE